MSTGSKPFLVIAITGRALAASAVRAGHPVVVVDCFADRDTRALASACGSAVAARSFSFDARRVLRLAATLAPPDRCAGLVYGSGFESRTGLLARLASGHALFGNEPSVIAAVKDPRRLFPMLDRLGIPHPEVRFTPPNLPTGWLIKQPGGAGGAHVRWAGSDRVGAGSYFQRFEPGRILSALFLADGRRACVLGFNEQWTAAVQRRRPFRYGGAVGGVVLPAALEELLRAKLDALVAATGLVGMNGVDFLLRADAWSVLEVNPRPTATAELYDLDYPQGLFEWHLRACEGELPSRVARPRATRAHGVVYAGAGGRLGPAFDAPSWCRDVPDPGTPFRAGDPVCTVHAAASDARRAMALLRRRQALVEAALIEEAA